MLLKIKETAIGFLYLIIFMFVCPLRSMCLPRELPKEYIYVWLPDKHVTEVREQVKKYLLDGLENAQKELKIVSEKVSRNKIENKHELYNKIEEQKKGIRVFQTSLDLLKRDYNL